jgi:hypothetical protein
VKFQVLKNGQPVEAFQASGAYLFGTDGTSLRRAKIVFDNGQVDCQKPTTDSAGLALLWPVEGFGRVLLPTTFLPDRERAYCLNVEIARARLMQIINRREEWSLFENAQDLEEISREAQDLFVKAVQRIRDPVVASQLADRSLRRAMVLSEKLALAHAEASFRVRKKARAFGRSCLGCRVDLNRLHEAEYVERLTQVGAFAVVPTCWAQIEPTEGGYDFAKLDQAIELLAARKMILGAGPLLCFASEDLPAWLVQGSVTFEKIREAAYGYVTQLVNRYSRKIHRWFVLGGLNAVNGLGFSADQVREMTHAATMAVKAVNSRAFRIIEVAYPWGEYYATVPNTIAPIAYMDMIVQSGVGFEAFALQMRFGKDQPGLHVRDMMQIASLLDVFALMGKPLYVTAVETPSQQGTGPFDPQVAGFWHKPWDPVRQAVWLEGLCGMALGRPAVDAVVFENLADREGSVIAHSGLLTADLKPKDSFRMVRRLREGILGN